MNLSSGLEATAQETRFLAGRLSQMPDYQDQFAEKRRSPETFEFEEPTPPSAAPFGT